MNGECSMLMPKVPSRPTYEECEAYWYHGAAKPLNYDYWYVNDEDEED